MKEITQEMMEIMSEDAYLIDSGILDEVIAKAKESISQSCSNNSLEY